MRGLGVVIRRGLVKSEAVTELDERDTARTPPPTSVRLLRGPVQPLHAVGVAIFKAAMGEEPA